MILPREDPVGPGICTLHQTEHRGNRELVSPWGSVPHLLKPAGLVRKGQKTIERYAQLFTTESLTILRNMKCSPIKLFYLFFLISGGCLILFGVYYIIDGNQVKSWPSVEGTITYKRIQTHSSTLNRSTHGASSTTKSYYPEISYVWTVDDTAYSGSRFGFGYSHQDFPEREEAEEAGKAFPLGQPITVYYDPEDPSQAVIDRSRTDVAYYPFLIGICFLGVGALFQKVSPQLEEGYRRSLQQKQD